MKENIPRVRGLLEPPDYLNILLYKVIVNVKLKPSATTARLVLIVGSKLSIVLLTIIEGIDLERSHREGVETDIGQKLLQIDVMHDRPGTDDPHTRKPTSAMIRRKSSRYKAPPRRSATSTG